MKKKKGGWKLYIGLVLMLLGGGLCGYLMARYIDVNDVVGNEPGGGLVHLGIELLLVCAAVYGQIIFHEAGHLVFGLLTGYRFSSFRIGSVMLLRANNKWHVCKMKIAGTGGQCLMAPPDLKDGRIPVMLYNFGGAIANTIASLIFVCLGMLAEKGSLFVVFCYLTAGIGIIFALVNGVPLRMGTIDNDGRNAFSLFRNPKALRGFWIQLKINEMQADGVRLKDMPQEWFELPAEEDMKNNMTAALGVFAANRMMDEHRFAEADTLIERLLDMESGIEGIHRYLLLMDRLYCEWIRENRPEMVRDIWDNNMKKFARSMKTFPTVIRTEYANMLLSERNKEAAAKIRQYFEKEMKRYPYLADVQAERELMEIADLAFTGRE